MFTINNYDYDCTKKCKNIAHGRAITAALTKKSIDDNKLSLFVAKTCRNFAEVTDSEGRTALHLCSSVGRIAIAEWLINNGANINQKDVESSHTALHRAIYYGHIDIAVLLCRYGASIDITDADFKIPLQLCCNPKIRQNGTLIKKEIVVWGNNKNYNLGIGKEQGKYLPQYIEEFNKKSIAIEIASIGQYHSIFLSDKGDIYAVGHGKGGRLGNGIEHTLVTPKKINISYRNSIEKAIYVSAGKYHSLVLTDHDNIYASGLNNHYQLGIKPPPEKSLNFREISNLSKLNGKHIRGVVAHDSYSLAYNENEIFVWGTNGGQFGIKNDIQFIILLQKLSISEHKIRIFNSNNSAIACCTANNYLTIFHKFKTRSIKSPALEKIVNIVVIGCEDSTTKDDILQNVHQSSNLIRILVQTDSNSLYIWYEDIQKYIRCVFPMIRDLTFSKIVQCSKKLLFLTENDGDLYSGTLTRFNSQQIEFSDYQETYNKKDICGVSKIKIDIKRIPNVNRVMNVITDESGENFIVLQESPKNYIQIPPWKNDVTNMGQLLEGADEFDTIHDVLFHIENRKFAAHQYIICCRAPGLGKIIQKSMDRNVFFSENLKLTAVIFEKLLQFIYTNRCLTQDEICSIQKSSMVEKKEYLNRFREILDKFEVRDYPFDNHEINRPYPRFNRHSHPELYDVTVNCLNGQQIRAHKCVLIARLEFFGVMFQHSWSESSTINLSTIPIEYMEPIIDYLYSKDFTSVFLNSSKNYSDNFIFQMLTICDQFFINQLRYNFEVMLLERFSVRNCGEILEFACSYNCEKLQSACIEYICLNLERVIENQSLAHLNFEILTKINVKYRELFPEVAYRMITPYIDAVSDEVLLNFVQDFHVDMELNLADVSLAVKGNKKIKFKPNKNVLDRLQYEKNAIAMIKDVAIIDDIQRDSKNTANNDELKNISNELQSEIKAWTKVNEKRYTSDVKTQQQISVMVKSNIMLKTEEKLKYNLTNLKDVISNVKSLTTKVGIDEITTSISSAETVLRSSINLGDFTPVKSKKLSQKQRKRLSSGSLEQTVSVTNTPFIVKSPSDSLSLNGNSLTPESVWGSGENKNGSISLATIMKSAEKNHKTFTLINNQTKLSPSSTSGNFQFAQSSKIDNINSDIFTIQQDERQQKEYYEKMKTKSLILTQIEETAIEELQKFYNVENTFDESIIIERQCKIYANFAVWNHQR